MFFNIHNNHDFKNLNIDQQIDLLIMQGGSAQVTTKENQEEFITTAVNYAKKAQNLGITTALYMTHAYTKADSRYEPNLIKKIKTTYYSAGEASNSIVIPVGMAYELAYAARPNIKLHHVDGTHPGPLGTYLAAATVLASITKESPVGLEFNYYDSISNDDRVFLQEMAWKAYLQSKKELSLK